MREGLNEENLTLFDLLCKPDLKPKDRNRIKDVARELLDHLKDEKLRIDNWWEKESTKAEVKTFIHDFLWDDTTGLAVGVYSPDPGRISQFLYHKELKLPHDIKP